jgi:hypothetical protein
MDFAFQTPTDPADPDPYAADGQRLVMRPVTSPAAMELARQLLESGDPGVELRPDGTLWALGVDRRQPGRND